MISQRDPRIANIKLGLGTTQTIGSDGCTISSIADVLGVDPTVVNDRLKAVNGFSGALVIWAKLEEAFPGIKIKRVWTYNNDEVKANVPNVIVEVPANAIGGSGKHWVRFIGNQQCNDPWTGQTRPTGDFLKFGAPTGYCIISGKWIHPQDSNYFVDGDLKLDFTNKDSMKIAFDMWVKVQRGQLIDKSLLQAALDKVSELEKKPAATSPVPSYAPIKQQITDLLNQIP